VDQAIIALDLQSQLRDAGYRSVGPATSNAAIRALAARGRIDGAVLDVEGVDFSAAEIADLLAQLRVPFVLLTSGRDIVPADFVGRPTVDKPYPTQELLLALEQAIGRDRA